MIAAGPPGFHAGSGQCEPIRCLTLATIDQRLIAHRITQSHSTGHFGQLKRPTRRGLRRLCNGHRSGPRVRTAGWLLAPSLCTTSPASSLIGAGRRCEPSKTRCVLKTISDALRQAIRKSDQTLYRIAKDAEVDWGTVQRFLDGTRANIRIDTIDKLCRHLGLTLGSASARAARARKG